MILVYLHSTVRYDVELKNRRKKMLMETRDGIDILLIDFSCTKSKFSLISNRLCLRFVLTHVHLRLRAAEKACALFDPRDRYLPFQVYLQCQRATALPSLGLVLFATFVLPTHFTTLDRNMGYGLIADRIHVSTFENRDTWNATNHFFPVALYSHQ